METLKIKTIGPIEAEIHLPGSKSYSNRALLIAALASGKSKLIHLLDSDDTIVMKAALKDLGVGLSANKQKDEINVDGVSGRFKKSEKEIYLQNAGTATRFMTTACALIDGQTIITGNDRMKQRPIQDLLNGLKQLGVHFECDTGCPPVKLTGPSLDGGIAKLSGQISSQYLSSILISAPYAKEPVVIEMIDELVSKPYVDITIDIMKKFGIEVKNNNYKRFEIPLGCYRGCDYIVEPDASGASYFLNAAALTKGHVKVFMNSDTVQGDYKYHQALEQMGCKVKINTDSIELWGGDLNAIEIDMEDIPDMVQSLAVVAAFANGTTKITNVYNLRVKETDRLDACTNELNRMGIHASQTRDSLTIVGGKPKAAKIETYDDHRMAMAFSGVGLCTEGIEILDPKCVNKTFPEFWSLLESLG